MNKSRQRDVILQVLRSTTAHPTAETIYEEARKIMPNISLGTVYRNLSLMADNGTIMKVDSAFEKDRYDGNPIRHTHFICTECGAVIDVALDINMDCLLGERDGLIVNDYNIVLKGLCDKCNIKENKEKEL